MTKDKQKWAEIKRKFDEWWPTADEFQQWMWAYFNVHPDPILAWQAGQKYLEAEDWEGKTREEVAEEILDLMEASQEVSVKEKLPKELEAFNHIYFSTVSKWIKRQLNP
ncbi:MAG: hypothetical protein ACFFE8_11335 [Candidatus Heimdallarchaeota archaeon]